MGQGITPPPPLPLAPQCIDPRLLMWAPSPAAASSMNFTAAGKPTENLDLLHELEEGCQHAQQDFRIELGSRSNAPTASTTISTVLSTTSTSLNTTSTSLTSTSTSLTTNPTAWNADAPTDLSALPAMEIATRLAREREQYDENRRRNEQLAIMEQAHHRAAEIAAANEQHRHAIQVAAAEAAHQHAARLAADEEAARAAHAKYLESMRITTRACRNKKLVRATWAKQSRELIKNAQAVGDAEMKAMVEATKTTKLELERLDREREESVRLQKAMNSAMDLDFDLSLGLGLDLDLNLNSGLDLTMDMKGGFGWNGH